MKKRTGKMVDEVFGSNTDGKDVVRRKIKNVSFTEEKYINSYGLDIECYSCKSSSSPLSNLSLQNPITKSSHGVKKQSCFHHNLDDLIINTSDPYPLVDIFAKQLLKKKQEVMDDEELNVPPISILLTNHIKVWYS
jgi:hypothetical protein